MDLLYKDLVKAIDLLKTSSGPDLENALSLILKIIKTKLLLPESLIRVILIRSCAIAKSKQVNIQSFQIIKSVIDSDGSTWIYEDNEDSKMTSTILLSALVVNIQKSDANIRKVSWNVLGKVMPKLNCEVVKACFPGLLGIVVEEVKRFRCQGLGASKSGFAAALNTFLRLIAQLNWKESCPWLNMAKERALSVVEVVADELIEVIKLGYEYDNENMLGCLEGLYLFEISKKNNLVKDIIALAADKNKEIKIEISQNLMKELLLKEVSGLAEISGVKGKVKALRTIKMCLNALGQDIISIFSLYSQLITDTIFSLIKFSIFEYSEFSFPSLILFPENNLECHIEFTEFIKNTVKYEIFDNILSQQQELLRLIRKDLSVENICKLLKISYIFHETYLEASMHILNEIIFFNYSDPHLHIVSKMMFIYFTQLWFDLKGLSAFECIENVLFVRCPETEKECIKLLENLCGTMEKDSIKALVFGYEIALKKSLLLKFKIFGAKNASQGIISFLQLSDNLEVLNDITLESLKIFDANYSKLTLQNLQSTLTYFSSLLACYKVIKPKLLFANPIRHILIRVKPLITLKPSQLENRKIIIQCLKIFYEALDLLNGVPLEIDPSDHSAFALEEEPNVSIPDALASIAYEFLPSLSFCLKSMSDSNCLGITTELLKIFEKISAFLNDFFETDSRFSKQIFPYLKIIMSSHNFSTSFHVKLKLQIVSLLNTLPLPSLLPITSEIIPCCNTILKNSTDPELLEQTSKLFSKIKKD